MSSSFTFPRLPFASAALAIPCAAASLAGAQTVRLSPALRYDDPAGAVRDFKLRPSGQFAFFLVDERQPGLFELFSVPALGGEPFRENLLFPPDRAVVAFDRSPTSPFVVYVADQDENDVFELYSRTFSDPAPRELSGAMPQGGDVTTFVIADDGSRVVYVADQTNDEVFELWSVPVDGSAAAVRISGPLVPGGDVVGTPLVSSATGRVVYLADEDADGVVEIYSTALDGSSPPFRLNDVLAPGGDVGVPGDAIVQAHPPTAPEAFALSPDGTTVVYLADQAADEVWELFRVPVDGSAVPVRIHPALAADRDVVTFRISPDGAHVVYLADQTTNQAFETFSAPLDGSGAPVRISDALQPAAWAAISPDSSNVVMVGAAGLFGAPIDGSSPAVPLDSSTFQFRDVAISPDSQRVVYRWVSPGVLPGECDTNVQVRSVPVDGHAAAVRLDDPAGSLPASCMSVVPEVPFVIAPSSSRVFYRWSSEGPAGLVSAPIDGGPQVELSAGHVGPRFALDPAGLRIFFQADPSGGEAFDLFSAAAASGAGRVKLSRRLARGTFSDVASFQVDAAGERAVFRVDRNVDGDFQLWSTRTDGQTLPRRLAAGGNVTDFRLGPDGELVLFRLYRGQPTDDVFSVPADGSRAPVVLNDPIPAGGDRVGDYRFSRDGTLALWAIGTNGDQPHALYSAPVAGGTSPNLLASAARSWILEAGPRLPYTVGDSPTSTLHSVPVTGGASVVLAPGLGGHYANLRVTPDGSRVVFTAGDPLGSHQLYSVPLDGSAGPTLHSGALAPSPAKLSPDGQWMLFASSGLHSARTDGTLGPVPLSGPLVPGGQVPYDSSGPVALFSPDSSQVVYLAAQDTLDVFELYVVPVDGSSAPVKLSGPLVSGGDVLASNTGGLEITPDGTRVVFAADKAQDGVTELWVVPIDGSTAPLLLSATMAPDSDLDVFSRRTFRITPDSGSVVYVTDQAITVNFVTQHLHEMFLVPIDRSSEPFKLHGPLANSGYEFTSSDPAGGVESFELSADSRRVVWSATKRAEVLELFGTVLTDERLPLHPAPGGGRHP